MKPGEKLIQEKNALVSNGYKACERFIEDTKTGKQKAQPGCSPLETLEALILGELSMIRDYAGKACLHNLSR